MIHLELYCVADSGELWRSILMNLAIYNSICTSVIVDFKEAPVSHSAPLTQY